MGTAAVEGELWGVRAKQWAATEDTTRPLWEAMLTAANVGPSTRFLDLGCGAAGSCVLAAKLGAHVSGFDASANLLDVARGRLPGVDFVQGEMEDLPYPDASFDVVFAANSLQYVDDKARALSEVRRVMAPGGLFVIGMWCEPDRCDMSVVFKAMMELAPPPPGGPPTLSVRANLAGLLRTCGFTIEEEGDVSCPFEFASVDDSVEGVSSAGVIVGIARVAGEDTVRQAIRDAMAPLADEQGRIRLVNWFRYMVCA